MVNKAQKINDRLFWGGIILLVGSLLSYYNEINTYFSTIGIIALYVSIALIIWSKLRRKK